MKRIVQQSALAALSFALLGCASHVAAVKDAVGLSSTKEATKSDLPAGSRGIPNASGLASTDVQKAVVQAQAQRRTGDFSGAARTLSQLVLFAPDEPGVVAEYGKTLVAQGRSDDALAFLERAIELNSGDWTLYSARGVAFDQKGDFKNAAGAYGRALTLQPNEPTVLSNAALSRMQAGDLDGAERLLLSAAQNGADNARVASNLTLVRSLKATRGAAAATAVAQAAPAPAIAPTAVVPIPAPVAAPAPVPVAVATPAAAQPVRRPEPPLAGQTALRINPNALLNRFNNNGNEPAPTLLAPGPLVKPPVQTATPVQVPAATATAATPVPGPAASAAPAVLAKPQVSVVTAAPSAPRSLEALRADPRVMVQRLPGTTPAPATRTAAAPPAAPTQAPRVIETLKSDPTVVVQAVLICPLQSGPKVNLDWTLKETEHGQEART